MNNSYTSNIRQGFTLIELLVVVLIIGILASVALPQYQKAVEKARLSEALSNISTVEKNFNLLWLENGDTGVSYYIDHELWAVDLTEGHWKDNAFFYTKNFYYAFDDGCGQLVCRCEGNCEEEKCIYNLWVEYPYACGSEFPPKICTGYNPIGKFICKSLEKDGWQNESDE